MDTFVLDYISTNIAQTPHQAIHKQLDRHAHTATLWTLLIRSPPTLLHTLATNKNMFSRALNDIRRSRTRWEKR